MYLIFTSMKRAQQIALLAIISLICGFTIPLVAGDNSSNFEEIRKILAQQERDWNQGNIDAFMEAYWESESAGKW